jgi:hypothetical protein
VRPPGAKRMIVSRPQASKVASGMRHALVLHDVSFVDVWEAMMVIEPEVAALAATRRTQADLAVLTQIGEAFRASPEWDPDAVNIVASFFEALGAASRNQVLVLAKQSLTQVLAPSLARMIDSVPQARARIADAQRRIVGRHVDQHLGRCAERAQVPLHGVAHEDRYAEGGRPVLYQIAWASSQVTKVITSQAHTNPTRYWNLPDPNSGAPHRTTGPTSTAITELPSSATIVSASLSGGLKYQ